NYTRTGVAACIAVRRARRVGAERIERALPHPVASPPDRDDDNHDDHYGDSGVEVHLPLAFLLLAAETQTRDIIGHVGPRPPKLWTRNKDFVIPTTTGPHRIAVAPIGTRVAAGPHTRSFPSEARRWRHSRTP